MKLFADDTPLFSTVYDNNASRDTLNGNLDKIAEWRFKWEMQLNPDFTKQAEEIIFSRKTMKPVHSANQFNDSPADCANNQKHLGLFLDEKLYFSHHMKEKIDKTRRGDSVIKKLSNVLLGMLQPTFCID